MNKVLSIFGLAASAVFCLAILAGCTTLRPTVPSSLLQCHEQPASPKAETQRDVALFIVDLAAAGDDCRTKLGAVRTILEPR